MTSKIRPNAGSRVVQRPDQQVRRRGSRCAAAAARRRSTIRRRKQFMLIDTCYATHHLQFDNDANETVYFNELTGPIVGWIDTKVYDETKDEQKAVGWCGQVVDTNGDGKITRSRGTRSPAVGGDSVAVRRRHAGRRQRRRRRARRRRRRSDPKLDTLVSFSLYARDPEPGRRLRLGRLRALSGLSRPRASAATTRRQSCMSRDLQGARAGLRSARRRHRHATASSGRRSPPAATWPASIAASARTLTGPAQDRRQPVPRRLDAVSDRPVRS